MTRICGNCPASQESGPVAYIPPDGHFHENGKCKSCGAIVWERREPERKATKHKITHVAICSNMGDATENPTPKLLQHELIALAQYQQRRMAKQSIIQQQSLAQCRGLYGSAIYGILGNLGGMAGNE